MIVVLQDRTQLVVDKKTADAIAKSLNKSSDGYLTINGNLIKKTFINMIKQGGITEADYSKAQNNNLLKSDNRSDEEQYKAARKKAEEIRKKLSKKISI